MKINYIAIPGLKYRNHNTPKEKADNIVNIVSGYFNALKEDIFSFKRKSDVVRARQICIWFLIKRKVFNKSQAGRYFDRDHTTVIHSLIAVQSYIETEPDYVQDIINIENLLP